MIDDKGGTATSAARTISVKFNAPPTVALTAPEEGQVFIFPADVSLAANAEDNDGTITKVDFYRGNTLIGTATSAPYTATWNDAPIGNYYNQIAAKATDDRGAVTTSATRSISVRTAPPTVELSSPEDGQQYVATATVELSVNATAATGASIKSVDYFRGTVRIATVTSAPYTYTWNDVAAGTHVMTARVIDDKNSTATSAARTITVKANEPPAVTLTAPETGQSFAAPANITISAGATDSDGAIARVDFYQGATLIGTATSTPYALSWNNVPIGAYSLTAKATDDKSATTTSAAHTIIVKANKAPTVALTAPEAEKNFAAPANITINAGATDSDGTIARVDFYRGATLIGTTTSTPYAISWNNVPIGTYSLTAKATDDKGATTTSAARGITVKVNQPPAIDLSAPADNQGYYGAPASITLMADATDSDGTITRVDFYQGNALIGTATSAPYAVTWNDVAIGAYSLTAKATDDKGASTTSAARTVEVEDSATREIYYIHSDHLNTPRLITDKQNQTVWRHSPLNEPFGAGTPEEDPDSTGNHFKFNLRFPGQYYDQETQTHYNYHRDYHPQTGRYLQSDPIGLEGGINPYAYVSGNPMRWIDPEGFATAVVGGLGFGASSGAAVGAGAGVAAGAAVAGAGVAGYAVGSAIYPHIEPSLSKAIDWCTSVMTGSGRWSCTASCNVQVISPSLDGKVSGRITGNAKGKTQQEACVEAKRVATQSVPRGTYARHCQCSCSKN